MAGLSLKHIYKIYPGKETSKKKLFRKGKEDDGKRSGDFVAVKDFNMEIQDGEFIVFVGPSGCGKSTTLRMIAGLEEITGGELFIGDNLVNDVDAKDRDIAMVFQSYALYPHMTSYQNIAFGLKIRKIPVEKRTENGEPVLEIDNKKVRELKSKLKTVCGDLRYAEDGEVRLYFKKYIDECKTTVKELKSDKANADAHKIRDMQERLTALKNAQKNIIAAMHSGEAEKLEEAKATARELGVNADEIPDSEVKLGLRQRKAKIESDLAYYSSTPVQAYTYKHMPKEVIDEKVKWAAEILGITELLDVKPSEMSGGQRQRIALGRAMVRGPKVFLLDEPLSNLDAKLRTTMRSEIVKLHNQLKTTFIYVTHDQIEAMTMGTRIVVMKLGVIQQIDTPTNLFDYPENKFVAGFIGTPQMNFFDVTVKKAGSKLETTFANGQKISYSLSKLRTINKKYLDGEEHELTLGVRGENISVKKDGLDATVTIKEVLGNTTQLFIKIDGDDKDYIVCVPDRNDMQPSDAVKISFDEKHIHLFDKQTELSVMSRAIGNK
ncbi:MAG: ATP-binding cassette domain-containing protein [Clostridia bacterium]|jgi:multiple sugar transport system ATP-binding protein|nr:ATP-binding cassette domain-containing protein [Clostridia bacterium]